MQMRRIIDSVIEMIHCAKRPDVSSRHTVGTVIRERPAANNSLVIMIRLMRPFRRQMDDVS